MKIVKRISIRTLPEDFCYNDFFVNVLSPQVEKIQMPDDCCVLTACNKGHFVGFQMLYCSLFLTHRINVVVIDLGLTVKQLDWCRRQKRLTVLKYQTPFTPIFYWQAWMKPIYLQYCPYQRLIWLDADAVFKGDLRVLLDLAKDKPLFTSDYTHNPAATLNWPELYHWLPLPNRKMDTYPYINTGLFVLDKVRDRSLIQEWCYIVMEAIESEHIRMSIACWDQGACKWALQELRLEKSIHPSILLNHPAKDREMAYPATKEAVLQLLYNIGQLKDALFVHWMGSPKPWRKWGEIINLDFAL